MEQQRSVIDAVERVMRVSWRLSARLTGEADPDRWRRLVEERLDSPETPMSQVLAETLERNG
ncbi:hypothetical protein BJF83_13725 [Nocardiopsis sp. CNR-923]|uniref:hypothetical protein n=1 Tax=Nocardiopsis sp. CNR-923 TaxID=1904965 RepID=UPI000968EAD1|nr:hypothetical protein [Nocardiopsis sp. CNR-923]OLT28845.1 hypothetical protein BJF83_13725 [Nocardiopsis sp. CNR-923]